MLTLCVVFVVTILLGVPVAFCLGLAGVAFIVVTKAMPLNVLPTLMFGGIDSFPLMAIPFFIMAGDLMSRSGVLPRLVDLANSLVGHFKGGLAYVNIWRDGCGGGRYSGRGIHAGAGHDKTGLHENVFGRGDRIFFDYGPDYPTQCRHVDICLRLWRGDFGGQAFFAGCRPGLSDRVWNDGPGLLYVF
jgi:hypothetical protein